MEELKKEFVKKVKEEEKDIALRSYNVNNPFLNVHIVAFINYFYSTLQKFQNIKMELMIDEVFNKRINIIAIRNGYKITVSYSYVFFETLTYNDLINKAETEALRLAHELISKERADSLD